LRSIFCTKSLCDCGQCQLDFSAPAIDDIADQVDGVGVVDAKEVQQSFGLRAACAEVDVGDKQSAEAPFGLSSLIESLSHGQALTEPVTAR